MDHNWIHEPINGKYNIKYDYNPDYLTIFVCSICNLVKLYYIFDNQNRYYSLDHEDGLNYLSFHYFVQEGIFHKGISCSEHLINKILL